MGRSSFDAPKYPPIDLLKAVIMERQSTLHISHKDLAEVSDMTYSSFRKMFCRHTDDWNPEVRRRVCRALGINIRKTIQLYDDSGDVRIE